MTEQTKTILIGAFIIVACLAMMGILLFLRPSVGDGGKRLYVCFTSIDKVQIGTRVTFAGKPVGEVVAIKEIYDARSQPTDRSGHVCFYELELAIDSHTIVYDTDEIIIHTTGLMGERTIGIIPKAVKKGQPSYPVTDQVLFGKSGDAVEEIINQLGLIGAKANEMMDSITKVLDNNEPALNMMLNNLGSAAQSVKQTLDYSHEIDLVGTIKNAGVNVSKATSSMGNVFDRVDHNGTIDNIAQASKNIADISVTINNRETLSETMNNFYVFSQEAAALKGKAVEALAKLNCAIPDIHATFNNAKNITGLVYKTLHCGEGTIGKLFKSEDFYTHLNILMGKADTLMNDVNSYGLLFHQNKTWQRERLKRIAQMYNLCTPEDFRRYFEEEINKVNISLARVAMSMKKAEEKYPCCPVYGQQINCQFSKLLNRLDDLEETLKLYQQELSYK